MDLDQHIENYINKEKQIAPSPFLQSRIMAHIKIERNPRKIPFGHPVAAAAGIVAVIVCGFLIGSSYNQPSKGRGCMVVNDSQIENFVILTDDAGE